MWAGGGAKKEGSVASAGPEAPTSPRAASPTASKGERPWRRYQGLVRLVRALELTKARVELEGDLSVSIWLDSVHRVIYTGSNDRDVVSEVVSRFHVHLEAAAHWAKDCFFRNCDGATLFLVGKPNSDFRGLEVGVWLSLPPTRVPAAWDKIQGRRWLWQHIHTQSTSLPFEIESKRAECLKIQIFPNTAGQRVVFNLRLVYQSI